MAAGNAHDVENDRLQLGERLTTLVDGVELVRLIDRDSMSDPEIAAAREQGVRVLRRRNLECYLLDDEVLAALCAEKGHPELAPDLISARDEAMNDKQTRERPRMTSSVARLSRPRDACSQSRRGAPLPMVPSRHPGPAIDGRDPGLPGTPRRLVWAAASWSGLRPRRRSPDSGMAPRHSAGYGPRTSCEKAHRPLGQLGSAGLARPPKPPAPTDGTCLRSAGSRTRTCRMNEPLPRTLPMLPPDESRSGGADGAADSLPARSDNDVATTHWGPRAVGRGDREWGKPRSKALRPSWSGDVRLSW